MRCSSVKSPRILRRAYQLITARCYAAPCGHVQHRHYDTAITQHRTHCTLSRPPVHLAEVSSYADQHDASVTHGSQSQRYGAMHPSVPSSADIICIREKFVPHMLTYCDPHISPLTDFEGAKLSHIFLLVCWYMRYTRLICCDTSLKRSVALPDCCGINDALIEFV